MLTGMDQMSNLRTQDVFKEILSDLVRKDVAKFSDKFSHFQYATLEMFKVTLNIFNAKITFFKSTPTFLQCIVKTPPISSMQLIRTPNLS